MRVGKFNNVAEPVSTKQVELLSVCLFPNPVCSRAYPSSSFHFSYPFYFLFLAFLFFPFLFSLLFICHACIIVPFRKSFISPTFSKGFGVFSSPFEFVSQYSVSNVIPILTYQFPIPNLRLSVLRGVLWAKSLYASIHPGSIAGASYRRIHSVYHFVNHSGNRFDLID